MNNITIRKGRREDVPALLDIYNYEVINGTATFDLQPKTLAERMEWYEEHQTEAHPLLVAELPAQQEQDYGSDPAQTIVAGTLLFLPIVQRRPTPPQRNFRYT